MSQSNHKLIGKFVTQINDPEPKHFYDGDNTLLAVATHVEDDRWFIKYKSKVKRSGLTLCAGDGYVGQCKGYLPHRQGTLLTLGNVYEGEWKDGQRHGQKGRMKYSSGEVYEGEWKDDQRHGQGKYTWKDGAIYEGEWKDGDTHGPVSYTHLTLPTKA